MNRPALTVRFLLALLESGTTKVVLLLLIFATTSSRSQNVSREDVVEIFTLAVEDNKLPRELFPNLDSISKLQFPNPFVVIRSNPELRVERSGYDSESKVMVWEGEELFLFNIEYWAVLIATQKRGRVATITYTTTTYAKQRAETLSCSKGLLKARRNDQKWVLIKARLKPVECTAEPKRR